VKSNEDICPSVYLELVTAVLKDAVAKVPAEVSVLRDLQTIRSRIKHEGISFLTITLPAFSKDFEKSLSAGFVTPTDFAGFRKSGAIPAFMRGMLGLLFDQETGRLLDNGPDSPTVVEAVRQVCRLFAKLEIPCTPERERAALENFVQVEQEFNVLLPSAEQEEFRLVSDVLWRGLVSDSFTDQILPRHGPGATAESIRGNAKYAWQFWYERLEQSFPFLGFAYSVSSVDDMAFEKVTFVPEDSELPVKVTLVPKTLKSPRVIAIEPVCMQYAQQSLQSYLYDRIGDWWLSAGHVNFTDQSINQRLALDSSADGRLATIDLSDASDRVPRDLALMMFDSVPAFRDAIDSCRSTHAALPDGRSVRLRKFASMGSALCFPVEAMYFYTICVMARLRLHSLPITPENVHHVSRDVYVYGDDIIVPADEAVFVIGYLQKYNCRVNARKSFWTGKFRESCGVDAYAGKEVTPTYLRRVYPDHKQQASSIISWVATANLFYLKGYWRAAALMFSTCERLIGDLPYVSPDSEVLGRVSFMGYRTVERWSDRYHRWEHRGHKPSTVYRCDSVDGYPALMKCLLSLERRKSSEDPLDDENRWVYASAYERWSRWQEGTTSLSVDRRHLERSARRGAVVLKRRWVPAT
jgi:hypothetical protein